MKKFSDVLLKIFGVGVTLCLFAGGIAVLGFIVAMFIGGETATEICIFIHKTYFPWVITFTSVFVGFGLIGMYLNKMKSLSISLAEDK
mgnify:CR=1 FL=1